MKTRPLLQNQAITQGGDLPSVQLVEIIQRLTVAVTELQDRLADVPEPTGGATVDAEARAAINAIRGV